VRYTHFPLHLIMPRHDGVVDAASLKLLRMRHVTDKKLVSILKLSHMKVFVQLARRQHRSLHLDRFQQRFRAVDVGLHVVHATEAVAPVKIYAA